MSSVRNISSRLRVLVVGTNPWPVVPRLVLALCAASCDVAVVYPDQSYPEREVDDVGLVFEYDGRSPLKSLQTAIHSFNPDIVVPSCDRSVQHLHELHAISQSQGEEGRKTAALIERSLGSPEGFPIVSSRFDLLKIAQSEGILVPRTASVSSAAEFQRWSTGSTAPWVIKADGTWGGQGVRIAHDMSEAQHSVEEFTGRVGYVSLVKTLLLNRNRDWVLSEWRDAAQRPVVAQSFINGRPANCAVVCWQGNVLASVAVEVIEARSATGPANMVRLVPGQEMIAAASKIARRLGISGFFGLDFMIEEGTGAVYLIEMNPRCTPPCALPLGAGPNFVAAFIAQLTGCTLSSDQPAVEQKVIAYASESGEVERIQKLLYPASRRSMIGRIFDLARRKQSNQPSPITFLTEPQTASTHKNAAAGILA